MDNKEMDHVEKLACCAGKKWEEISDSDIWNEEDSGSSLLFIFTDILVNLIVFAFICLIGFFLYDLYSLMI
ncbi:TPA: hypothetical protein ACRZZI_004988 [Vibrio harveyi]